MKPVYFASPAEWRAWLERHHDTTDELWVGFHKKATGRPSLTWPESVDQALCFGWIDGIRKRVDEARYVIRFTPRRKGSPWSLVNRKRVQALTEMKLMRPAGLAAFETRGADADYSYEQTRKVVFSPAYEKRFKAHPTAWRFFQSRPPSYRRTVTYWVMSAKQEETRQRRLDALIARSQEGKVMQ